MSIGASRRGFIRGLMGASAFAIGGCRSPFGSQKIRLAVVGMMGKGFSDWMTMYKTGLVEIVAFCDCDEAMRDKARSKLAHECVDFPGFDAIPFYSDYRKLLDDAGMLGVDAMTISTPDHVHAPVAIRAMSEGIHVFVQKPLVRTLWELDYFERTAKENGVIVQMGNQGSALGSLRRAVEVLQSGILGDVKEVHVWTNRPVWPQGKAVADWVKGHAKGDSVPANLNWDVWLSTAAKRPYLGQYGEGVKAYDPWKLGKSVYHTFTWRGFRDFGCGAFGDMACHTMNLAFRGLELGGVSAAECIRIEEGNDIAYPTKSVVKLTYKARKSVVRSGEELPEVTLFWYDGFDEANPGKSGNKPKAELMPKVVEQFGAVPDTGCYIIGTKGVVLMQDDYGAKCVMALEGDKTFTDILDHEAARAVPRSIPYCVGRSSILNGSSVEMKGFAEGHYEEFLHAILGEGPIYAQTHSRCFSDIEYCIPQMEGILVGCIAQQVPGEPLIWDAATQSFGDNVAANRLVRPFIRRGFEF